MGFFKDQQLALLEEGYSEAEANAAIARRLDPEGARREQDAKRRKLLQEACDTDSLVAIGVRHKAPRGRLRVYGVGARFVETSRGAINIEQITTVRIIGKEEPKY